MTTGPRPMNDEPPITIRPKCEACKDTGEVEMRIQFTDRRRPCEIQLRPCPFCEEGRLLDQKQRPATTK